MRDCFAPLFLGAETPPMRLAVLAGGDGWHVRDLLRAARRNDWEVLRFSNPVPLRERVPMPKPQHAAIGGGAVVLLLAASLAARWWWARRQPPVPVAPASA